MNKTIIIRGGGDLATGTISCLHQCGYQVLVLEIAKPTAIRRSVAFSEAMYDGETEVEGIKARKITQFSEAEACWQDGIIPIICDEKAEAVKAVPHFAFVDAAIAKRNLGTTIDMADYVIGLGRDLLPAWMWMWSLRQREDIVSDVLSGRGRPLPIQVSRVLSAVMAKSVSFIPRMQVFSKVLPIWEISQVKKGDLIAKVDDAPVYATLDGVLRRYSKRWLTGTGAF